MKRLFSFLMMFISKIVCCAPVIHVFVSFSMPAPLLEQTLKECAHYHVSAYLNGLAENSMKKTAQKVMDLSKKVPDLNLQIDPTLFEKYNIKEVPAIVCENGDTFDILKGNIKLKEVFNRFITSGDCGLTTNDVLEMAHG